MFKFEYADTATVSVHHVTLTHLDLTTQAEHPHFLWFKTTGSDLHTLFSS